MNSQDTNKSSEQLQREVHGQINKIADNIETARVRMSPGNLLDDAIFYPHGKSLSSTYEHLKNNPMGSMFLSLGTLLLMEDQEHISYESRFKSSAADTWEQGKEEFRHAKENFSEKSTGWSESAKESIQRAKERFQSKAEEFKAKGLKSEGKQRIESAKTSAREAYESAKHRLEEITPRIGSARENIHPFAIASLGLGLGASLGASFPIKSVEAKLQNDSNRDQLRKLSSEFDDAIREAGERVKNQLIDELKSFNFH